MDERVCPKHQDGKHCWHEHGSKAFKGKWETTSPVECCHCGALAKQRAHAAEWLEFDVPQPPESP